MQPKQAFILEIPSALSKRLNEYSQRISPHGQQAWAEVGGFIIFTFGLDFIFIREKVKEQGKLNLALVF